MLTPARHALTLVATLCAVLAASGGAQAAQDCSALRGCAAKFCSLENEISAAQAQGNRHREAGLRRALSEARGSCTDASLRAERQDALTERRAELAEREAELAEARRKGEQDKIDKALRKLQDAQDKLKEAQADLQR